MRKILLIFAMLMFVTASVFAQTRTVKGVVHNEKGDPVPFVTVAIKGTKSAVSADANGSFLIRAKVGDVLVISGIGIKTQEATITDASGISITVSIANNNLSEVVVTSLGIKRNRNTLPYSAQQISGSEMNRSAVTMNPVSNLSGKIAGLQITQESTMGGSTNVILRGLKSLTQTNQALFVVDGIPFDNSNYSAGGYDLGNAAFDLNPDDIESVSVLKGAAASALYGSRASNGVILITTKKAVKRKGIGVSVSLGGTTGSFDKSTLPTYQTQYGEGYGGSLGFVYNYPTFFSNTPVNIVETDADAATGPVYDPTKLVYNWDAFMPGDPNYGKATPWQPAANHNPQDFFINPVTSSASILAQGGGDNGSFKIGFTHNEDKDFIPNSRLAKNLVSFSSTYKLVNNVSIT